MVNFQLTDEQKELVGADMLAKLVAAESALAVEEKRVADEMALSFANAELHGKVLYLVIVGLGGEVAVTADEGIGPVLGFF